MWAAVESIAPMIDCTPQILLDWIKPDEVDRGERDSVSTDERERIKVLEREVKELRRANEILKVASAFSPRRSSTAVSNPEGFRRSASRYLRGRANLSGLADCPVGLPAPCGTASRSIQASTRAKRAEMLMPEIKRVWQANMQVYGVSKVWQQMNRKGIAVARCTVGRLMRQGLRGTVRGKRIRTTLPDMTAPRPLDRVNRQFKADRPNPLWVSDFTCISTWQGWLYVDASQ